MDRGLWVTWYDLPKDGRAAYFSWLQETYMPAVLKRPGVQWGAHYECITEEAQASTAKAPTDNVAGRADDTSIPAGKQFVLIFGGKDTHVFANPVPSAFNAALPDSGRKMLALRSGERMSIFAEGGRVEGPALKNYKEGMLLAPCMQIGTYNCDYKIEEDMLAWYAQRRMAALSEMTGCIRTRKLAAVAGWAKHSILYEFESLEALNKYFPTREDKHPEQQAWSKSIVKNLTHAPGSANLGCRMFAMSN